MTNYADVCRKLVDINRLTNGKVDIDISLFQENMVDDYGKQLPEQLRTYIQIFIDLAASGKRKGLASNNCLYSFEPFGFETEKREGRPSFYVKW